MHKSFKVAGIILLMPLVLLATGCRTGGDPGTVKVVRNGGPFDNKKVKDIICPSQHSKYIGANSTTHAYPAFGVQRYFKITSDAQEGADYQGVVSAKTADGFNVHLSGTFQFQTVFDCQGAGKTKLIEFDRQFGVRKFPDPAGGEDKAPWEGDRGWSAFLSAQMLPIIQNELRIAMLKFTCEEIVSSCALVASRQSLVGDSKVKGIDKKKAKQTGVNLQQIQGEIEKGFSDELASTFGKQYFTGIKFLMSQPELDAEIEGAINKSLSAFAVVSQATAQVQQATQQAAAAYKLANVYRSSPQLAELERWRIICGVKPGDNTTSKCGNATFIMGDSSGVQVRAGK